MQKIWQGLFHIIIIYIQSILFYRLYNFCLNYILCACIWVLYIFILMYFKFPWVILYLAYAQSLNQINYNQYKTCLPFSSQNLKVWYYWTIGVFRKFFFYSSPSTNSQYFFPIKNSSFKYPSLEFFLFKFSMTIFTFNFL